jgi:hypothetical protein
MIPIEPSISLFAEEQEQLGKTSQSQNCLPSAMLVSDYQYRGSEIAFEVVDVLMCSSGCVRFGMDESGNITASELHSAGIDERC